MNINIFGIGRSGTKAVQLYISYLLAVKYGEVWINYEPYQKNSRHGLTNYEGLHHDIRGSLFMLKDSIISRGHSRYIKKLYNHNSSIVTKYIRANGRIEKINYLSNPDYTFIIIRDLYEVLNSLLLTNFHFFSFGSPFVSQSYTTFWYKLIKETKDAGLVEDIDYILNQISQNDFVGKNAFYWYVMNLKALNYNKKCTHFLSYSEIHHSLPVILSSVLDMDCEKYNFSNPFFYGQQIHLNNVLLSEGINIKHQKIISLINQYLYFLGNSLNITLPIIKKKVGCLSKPTKYDEKFILPQKKKIKVEVKKNDLLDFFNKNIQSKLKFLTSQ